MQRLDLDFHRSRPASAWIGWVILVVTLAFIAEQGAAYRAASRTLDRNEARVAVLERAPDANARRGAAAPAENADEMAMARETIRRIATPWGDLFAALESATPASIALLSLDPDPKSGRVVIAGESGSFAAVLEYIARLRGTGTLSDVHLLKNEMERAQTGQPVRFAVSAAWKEAAR